MIREQNAKCKQIIDAFNPYKNPYSDNNPYLKIPFRRPQKIYNSFDYLFINLAYLNVSRVFVTYLLYFLAAVSVFHKMSFGINKFSKETIITCFTIHVVFYHLPNAAFLFVLCYFGMFKKQPICSCKDVLDAHKKILTGLSKKRINGSVIPENPFSKTPWYVRNALPIFVKYCIFGFIASLTAFIILNTVLYDDVSPEMVLPLIGSINKSTLSRVFFFQTIFFFVLLFLLKNFNKSDEVCASECEDLDMALIAESK